MSAPDNPSSKARPSLLSDTAKSAAESDSRILASLEGRVAPQHTGKGPRRSGKLWGVAAAVAVIGAGAWGVWQWQHGASGDVEKVAAAPAHSGPVQPGTASPQAGSTAAASGADALAHAASAPQPAVIVSDNVSDPQSHAATSGALNASAPSAASVPAADEGRLSRALTGDSSASAAAVAPARNTHAKQAAAAHEPSKHGASRTEREADKKRHAPSALARKDPKATAKPTEDQDVDLLTALVARTKPYDSKKGAGDKPASGAAATKKGGRIPSLADQMAECSKRGLIESQFCRWHVCADHWGKDPACPTANTSTATH